MTEFFGFIGFTVLIILMVFWTISCVRVWLIESSLQRDIWEVSNRVYALKKRVDNLKELKGIEEDAS